MIFVTVGTHEDQFNRLVQEMDRLLGENLIEEEVFIQSGYSDYQPKYARFKSIIGFPEMDYLMQTARVVITHGGPGSIMHALRYGKIPIVVPRQSGLGEHVDDHQVKFAMRLTEAGKIIAVLDINDLSNLLKNYEQLSANLAAGSNQTDNLERIIAGLEQITRELLKNTLVE